MGWSTSDAGDSDIWGNRPIDFLGNILGGDVHGNAAGDLWGPPRQSVFLKGERQRHSAGQAARARPAEFFKLLQKMLTPIPSLLFQRCPMIDCDLPDDSVSGDESSSSGAGRLVSIGVTVATGIPILGFIEGKLVNLPS